MNPVITTQPEPTAAEVIDDDLSVSAFRAMGSACRLVTAGGPPEVASLAQELVADLERRWSRFLDTSEISQLNRRAGLITIVSEPTYQLLHHAALAQEATAGRFNPLMLDQLEAHGYRLPFEAGMPVPTGEWVGPAVDKPIELFSDMLGVRLPAGCRFDPGGIGKGLAADLVADLCADLGAHMACVDLGGDLRVFGQPWYGPSWRIGVEDPFDQARELASFTPTEGAVTTSTTTYRTWPGPDGPLHHLLDPTTGLPGVTDLVSVTTCSSRAWWAEVAAKTALLAGSTAAVGVFEQFDTPGLAVTHDGRIVASHLGGDGRLSTVPATTDGLAA